ncbi:alpha/beta fold hydrolase [Leptolyngbya sp. O-77]|uniref:alpha/beta fold hydrolase n=1 Tax=Leptolyngbya sp. O-77 TaxID=1080068 RepID=UPI00074D4790|nr:alpha/beta fold hydrolase [Leptolyngbya sp. O-77]BAU42120.1 2-hydroxy-6-oxo-6-(2'-aminophenyl)hexa-2, 4-dienoic acid hydrolase [Leptolyngbya sp. O-77]
MTSQLTAPQPLEHLNWDWQGHTIRYTVQGTGQPIVLIHGFGAAIGHWRNNIPVLAAAGYRVFALDLLGFGGSSKPAIAYSLELWQDLLRDFWAAHIGAPAVFVGNSIGALLSLMMAADYPDLVQRVVLLNAAGGLNHRPEELNPPLRLVMGVFTQLVSSDLVGPFLFEQVRKKPRIRRTLMQVYRDHTAVTDELVNLIYEPSCDPGAQKVFASILTAPPGPSPAELLPHVQQPILVLWGDADPWTPIAGSKIYRELAAAEPDRVQYTPIAEAGHCPHDECPDTVNRLLLDWLSAGNRE